MASHGMLLEIQVEGKGLTNSFPAAVLSSTAKDAPVLQTGSSHRKDMPVPVRIRSLASACMAGAQTRLPSASVAGIACQAQQRAQSNSGCTAAAVTGGGRKKRRRLWPFPFSNIASQLSSPGVWSTGSPEVTRTASKSMPEAPPTSALAAAADEKPDEESKKEDKLENGKKGEENKEGHMQLLEMLLSPTTATLRTPSKTVAGRGVTVSQCALTAPSPGVISIASSQSPQCGRPSSRRSTLPGRKRCWLSTQKAKRQPPGGGPRSGTQRSILATQGRSPNARRQGRRQSQSWRTSKSVPCFNASEIAGIIGLQTNTKPLEALVRCWGRQHPSSCRRWQRETGGFVLPEVAFKRHASRSVQRAVKKAISSGSGALPEQCGKAIAAAVKASAPQSLWQTLIEEGMGQAHRMRGVRMEKQGLDAYEEQAGVHVVERNQRCWRRSFGLGDTAFVLAGRVDGFEVVEGERLVVEHKRRQRRLFNQVVAYEEVQCHAYMVLTDTRACRLVQTMGTSLDVQQIDFSSAKWNCIVGRLHATAQLLRRLWMGAISPPVTALAAMQRATWPEDPWPRQVARSLSKELSSFGAFKAAAPPMARGSESKVVAAMTLSADSVEAETPGSAHARQHSNIEVAQPRDNAVPSSTPIAEIEQGGRENVKQTLILDSCADMSVEPAEPMPTQLDDNDETGCATPVDGAAASSPVASQDCTAVGEACSPAPSTVLDDSSMAEEPVGSASKHKSGESVCILDESSL